MTATQAYALLRIAEVELVRFGSPLYSSIVRRLLSKFDPNTNQVRGRTSLLRLGFIQDQSPHQVGYPRQHYELTAQGRVWVEGAIACYLLVNGLRRLKLTTPPPPSKQPLPTYRPHAPPPPRFLTYLPTRTDYEGAFIIQGFPPRENFTFYEGAFIIRPGWCRFVTFATRCSEASNPK